MRRLLLMLGMTLRSLTPLAEATAAEYVVSPDGNDANDGSRGRPWKSLEKVNESVHPGDTVAFLPGDYPGTLSPRRSGEPGKPIVFRSQQPLKAVWVGGNPVIVLEEQHHLVFEALTLRPKYGRWMTANGCTGLTIADCRCEGSRTTYSGMRLRKCTDVRLLRSTFEEHTGNTKLGLSGHSVDMYDSKGILIEGNRIGRAGHCPLYVAHCDDAVVRRNFFFADWGRALSLMNVDRALFEENVIVGAWDSHGSAGAVSEILGKQMIVRRNLAVRNYGAPLSCGIWGRGKGFRGYMHQGRFYNNTVAYNLDGAWSMGSWGKDIAERISDNIWKNNTFYHNDALGRSWTVILRYVDPRNTFVNNIIRGAAPGEHVFSFLNEAAPWWSDYTLEQARSIGKIVLADNLDVAPKFVNPRRDDFRPARGCPSIDAGAFLTQTTEAGQGRRMPVEDALWFFDGFGVANQKGDVLYVGRAKKQARVEAVDVEKNVLTLDSELAWEKGDSVSLPYVDKAPDIGAMEYGAEREPWFCRLRVPPGSYWTPPTARGVPLVTCDFENRTALEWGTLWNMSRRRSKHERTSETSASGKYSLRVYAEKDKSTLSVDTTVRLWEIDRFPFVRFAYRIPKGVPVGIWLRCFRVGPGESGPSVCIGGSPAMKPPGGEQEAYQHELIHDDAWHTTSIDARIVRKVYPKLKHLRGFDFRNSASKKRNGLAKKDDCFWFDDFSITGFRGTATDFAPGPTLASVPSYRSANRGATPAARRKEPHAYSILGSDQRLSSPEISGCPRIPRAATADSPGR